MLYSYDVPVRVSVPTYTWFSVGCSLSLISMYYVSIILEKDFAIKLTPILQVSAMNHDLTLLTLPVS